MRQKIWNNIFRRKKDEFSITARIFMLLILQIILPIIVIGCFSLAISTDIMKMQMEKYYESIVNLVKTKAIDYNDNLFTASQEMMYDNNIFEILTSDEENSGYDKVYVQNLIERILFSYNDIEAINLVIEGEQFSTAKCKNEIYAYGTVAYNDMLKSVKNNPANQVWYFDETNNTINSIFMVRILCNPYNDTEKGVLIFQISKNIFKNICQDFKNTDNYTFSVFTREGDVIYTSGSDAKAEALPQEGISDYKGDKVICSLIDDMGWYVVCRVNLAWMYKDIYFTMECMLILCLISTFLLSITLYFIQKEFINPINLLAHTMKNWQEDGKCKIEYKKRADEIGVLYDGFNDMNDSVNRLINENYRDSIIKKEIELKMLQAQINPHFLFNTLESINCVAQLNNVPEISKMVVALSDILSESMGKSGKTITIENEIYHVESYLYIMKARFGDKISVTMDLAGETIDVKIPALTLQTIVENAIRHGKISKTTGGNIHICSYLSGDIMCIEVRDNGVGMDEEKAAQLNAAFNIENDIYFREKNGQHIGLENVNRRIKLLYGNESGLCIESKPNEGTVVKIRLKMRDDLNA